MKIKAASIRYRLKSDPETDKVVWGYNHSYCYDWLYEADIYSFMRIPEHEKEGFLTDTGEFVDRYRAYEIAKEAGQLRYEREDKRLISAMVVFDVP